MLCPSCASENPADARFCEECGAQLEGVSEGGVAVATREGPLAPGAVVAERFTVERLVDSGGSVHLYEAASEEGRVLLVEAEDEGLVQREWDLLTSVEGESLWRPTEMLSHEGRRYLVGPWPGAESLQGRLASGPMAPDAVAEMGEALLVALETLHGAGWLHKGLSPDAVWVDDGGRPLLTRFERVWREDEPNEHYSVIQGYSSPEAYGMQGGVVDRRSDLFSLGAVLYSALTGERRNLEARESFFTFPRPKTGGALADVILKAVAREPERRYASAAEMLEALRDAKAHLADDPAPAPAPAVASPEPRAPVGSSPGTTTGGGYHVAMKSHVGMVRSINQDACLELRLSAREKDIPITAHLVVVADGMGGEAEGDKAASLAIRALAHEVVERFLTFNVGTGTTLLLPPDPAERNAFILRRGMERANRTIFQYASQDPSRRGMGCTMTAVLLEGDLAVFGHVGDTRGYRFAEDQLDQVTTDHSLVGRLVQMGRLTREEARHSPQRSVIYRALGTNPEVEVDLYDRKLAAGEYLLVSSDGVWEYYDDEELLGFFQGGPAPEAICERLVQTCLDRGADDNATCAIVQRA